MKGRGVAVLAVLSLLAAASFVVGCGSSSSSSAETTTAATNGGTASSGPLTKRKFVKQANQICQKGLAKKDENVSAATKSLAPDGVANASKEVVGKLVAVAILPVYGEIIEELDELSPPKSDAAPVDLIVQKYESAMQAAEESPASATENNPFQAGDRAAEAYGVTHCIL